MSPDPICDSCDRMLNWIEEERGQTVCDHCDARETAEDRAFEAMRDSRF